MRQNKKSMATKVIATVLIVSMVLTFISVIVLIMAGI